MLAIFPLNGNLLMCKIFSNFCRLVFLFSRGDIEKKKVLQIKICRTSSVHVYLLFIYICLFQLFEHLLEFKAHVVNPSTIRTTGDG